MKSKAKIAKKSKPSPKAKPAARKANRSYVLYQAKGTGSTLAEACLHLAGAPYELVEVDYDRLGPTGDAIAHLNPLGQLPTLTLPDGSVMTESAAIALHLSEKFKRSGLAPSATDKDRPAFLRWLTFMVASIYPNFTYGDVPVRWVSAEVAQTQLRDSTNAYNQKLWKVVEAAVGNGPWFLGKKFSVLDVYVCVMSHWRPGRAWFQENCPKLFAIATRADAYKPLQKIWNRNFRS